MKRRIIEALVPLTMWLLENWPRKLRPNVMVLPEPTLIERVKWIAHKTKANFLERIELRLDALRKYWGVLQDSLT